MLLERTYALGKKIFSINKTYLLFTAAAPALAGVLLLPLLSGCSVGPADTPPGSAGPETVSSSESVPTSLRKPESSQEVSEASDQEEALRSRLAYAQEQNDALQQSVLEDTALSQADINSAYDEMYRLWDGLLNDVWQTLTQLLSPEEMEALTQEELEWIAWKEQQIAEAGAEYGGGSLQIMAQSQRGAEVTRDRVYELMECLETP